MNDSPKEPATLVRGVYQSGATAKLQCFYDTNYSVRVPCICSVIVGQVTRETNELSYGVVLFWQVVVEILKIQDLLIEVYSIFT